MKTFIAVVKAYKQMYKEAHPFIWVMCKDIVREDIKHIITKLEVKQGK